MNGVGSTAPPVTCEESMSIVCGESALPRSFPTSKAEVTDSRTAPCAAEKRPPICATGLRIKEELHVGETRTRCDCRGHHRRPAERRVAGMEHRGGGPGLLRTRPPGLTLTADRK